MGKWKRAGRFKAARRWRVKTLIRKYRGECAACGCTCTLEHNAPDQATVDHIQPLSRGGDDRLCNLQLLCRRCNTSKGDTVLDADGEVSNGRMQDE